MEKILLALIILILLVLVYQDFQYRKVSLLGLVLLFIFAFTHSMLSKELLPLLKSIFFNTLIFGLILVSGTLLVKIQKNNSHGIKLMGAGDYLFLFAISPLFCFESFLVFLNTSFLLILIIYFIHRSFLSIEKNTTIPLAGYLSISLLFMLIIDIFSSNELLLQSHWIYPLLP